MGWLDDLLYPDNEKRRERATQLYNDCETLTAQLGRQRAALDTAFADLAATFGNLGSSQTKAEVERLGLAPAGEWLVTVPRLAVPLATAASSSLNAAFLAAVLGSGGNALSSFVNLFGLPEGFPRRQSKSVDLSDTYGLLPAAMNGATARSQLRDLMKSLGAARLQLQRAVLTNLALLDALKGLGAYAATVSKSMAQTSTGEAERAEQAGELLHIYVEELESVIASVSDETGHLALQRLDRDRGAWVSEDEYVD